MEEMAMEKHTQPQDQANDMQATASPTVSELVRHKIGAREAAAQAFLRTVGARYQSCTLQNFVCSSPSQRQAVAALEVYASDIVERLASGQNILLFGSCGTGKDHLLASLARAVLLEGGEPDIIREHVPRQFVQVAPGIKQTLGPSPVRVLSVSIRWENGVDLFGQIRDRMRTDDETEDDFIGRLLQPDVLILSDPMPPRAGSLTDFQSQMLYRIVDGRYRDGKAIWASMNVSGSQEADQRMGAQLVDRLKDGALSIACSWPSYRRVSQTVGYEQEPCK
jgi:DNA replication protein DnaC